MRRSTLMLTVALVMALMIAVAGPAFAEAGAPASCVGHEASNISPPGSSEEFPGGMPELQTFIRENFPGTPPGAISSSVAKLHEGSHEACDEALE
jgi:hypothetical protein